jgi:16S rRNA (guanine1207-N2)-methyltransferase
MGAASVRVSDDSDPATEALDASVFDGTSVVLLRLPKSLAALDRLARLVASSAPSDVVVVAGGRLKYMSLGMNEVLSRSFETVDVSLARQKSRVLVARRPQAAATVPPSLLHDDELGLWVGSVGGVFAGSSVDIGTRALLSTLDRTPDYGTAVDLGCGTGILAAELKRRRPTARVIASDVSADAVASARETAKANGLDFEIVRQRGLENLVDASVDLVLLNPPFHDGGGVSLDAAHAMFGEAARVLKPGAQLWTVWNSHLGYATALRRIVGPTTELARTPKFTVTASTKSID